MGLSVNHYHSDYNFFLRNNDDTQINAKGCISSIFVVKIFLIFVERKILFIIQKLPEIITLINI